MSDFFFEPHLVVDRIKWETSDEYKPYFIECHYSEDQTTNIDDRIKQGYLEHDQLKSWAEGCAESDKKIDLTDSNRGGIRLVVVHRRLDGSWSLTREAWDALAKSFNLPAITVAAILADSSQCFSIRKEDPNLVSFLLTCPAFPLGGPRGMSQTYNASTRWTTAIVVGVDFYMPTKPSTRITDILKKKQHIWWQPSLLPTTILQIYIQFYINEHRYYLSKLWGLEGSIGVTNTIRGSKYEKVKNLENWPASIDIKPLTLDIHSLATSIVLLGEACEWAGRSAKVLLDMETAAAGEEGVDEALRMMMKDTTEMASSVERSSRHMHQRFQIQANVLYSATAQRDNILNREYSRLAQEQNTLTQRANELNIRIASSTKKDSIAMMAFTFITALFLPGTYVSSLFSMSMFNWMPDSQSNSSSGSGDSRVVAGRFWVYWVVTIPLTVAVMAGWYFWYRAADSAWRREAKLEMETSTSVEEGKGGSEKAGSIEVTQAVTPEKKAPETK